jgi:hypothetical protein
VQIIKRADAIAKGLTRFFNGRPCSKCGAIAPRLVSNWNCIACLKHKNENLLAQDGQIPRRSPRYAS